MHIRGPQEEGVARPATSGQRQSTITPRPTAEVAAPGKPPPDRSLPPRLRTADRQQLLSPLLIDDLIEADHPARAVWHFAEGLDLSVLYDRIRARGPVAGRPAIDPRLLVALWLYATLAGVKSANALATLCIHHDAYFWLAGGLAVNAHTLSDFRVQDADVLERMLEHSVTVLRQQGLIDLDRVAQDGMRVRASAGAASFRRRETLARLLQEARAEVQRWQPQADAPPDQEQPERSPQQRAAQLRHAQERVERIQRALRRMPEMEAKKAKKARATKKKSKQKKGVQRVQKNEAARVSTTDPDATVMKKDAGWRLPAGVQRAAQHDLPGSSDRGRGGSDGGDGSGTIAPDAGSD